MGDFHLMRQLHCKQTALGYMQNRKYTSGGKTTVEVNGKEPA